MKRKFLSETPLNALFVPSIQIKKGDIVELDTEMDTQTRQYRYFLIDNNTRYPISHTTYGRIVAASEFLS